MYRKNCEKNMNCVKLLLRRTKIIFLLEFVHGKNTCVYIHIYSTYRRMKWRHNYVPVPVGDEFSNSSIPHTFATNKSFNFVIKKTDAVRSFGYRMRLAANSQR